MRRKLIIKLALVPVRAIMRHAGSLNNKLQPPGGVRC